MSADSTPWQEMITTEQRKFLMDELLYDPASGLFCWARDGRGKAKRKGEMAGAAHTNGYVRIKVAGKTYLAHRLAWLFVHGRWPSEELDHINRDKADNRICNLREATVAENRRNTRGQPRRRARSKFKGVSPENKSNKWVAKLNVDGKTIALGRYDTEEEAAAAYRDGALKHHGEFAAW